MPQRLIHRGLNSFADGGHYYSADDTGAISKEVMHEFDEVSFTPEQIKASRCSKKGNIGDCVTPAAKTPRLD